MASADHVESRATPRSGGVRRGRALTVTVVTVCLLAAMYVAFRSSVKQQPEPPRTRTYRIRIEGLRLASGPARLVATQGDSIALTVTADRAGTLHVHEYEQQFVVPLNSGEEATTTFTAGRAGRFAVHVMGIDPTHPEVAAIQVHPR